MRIGILGGTFDPTHNGHLAIGSAALTGAELDQVRFVPAGVPWQKADREITPAFHRVRMLHLAVDDRDEFAVDGREIRRTGPTYTIDTLESFPRDTELFLILGADSAAGIETWHRYSDVLARAGFVVLPRPGFSSEDAVAVIPHAIYLDMEPVDVSSTEIRRRVGAGEEFDHLVPPEVASYISAHGLYAKPVEDDMVVPHPNLEEES